MDASRYLLNQGWRGEGHSLDHTNRGIKKPLLVSKKVDVLGVGLNKHASVSDQWWLRAFDEGLKNFGSGKESALAQVQKHGVHRGGLYAGFVKGEKLEGSIENSLVDSQGTSTPVETRPETLGGMGIDIPHAGKLERTAGNHDDQNAHDAMMHLLQNPDDAPASMQKLLDRKRKRAERPVEKRARRKTEKDDKAKTNARDAKRKAKEDGTWDEEAEAQRKQERLVNKRASEVVLAAQQFGYIPAGPNEIRKGQVAVDARGNTVPRGEPTEELKQIFASAGFTTVSQKKSSTSGRGDKFAREKMKRQLKAAAKAYYMGVKPPKEHTEEELRAEKDTKKAQRAKAREDAARKEANRMARREERQQQKRERRKQRKAEKEAVDRVLAGRLGLSAKRPENGERQGISTNGSATESSTSDSFENGADGIKFGMNSKGGLEKIPGIGVVERHPSKAEKKARKLAATAIGEECTEEEVKAKAAAELAEKRDTELEKADKYRAMKHGMSLEQYRDALARGDVHPPDIEKKDLPREKLAEYRKRAEDKGVSLEQYIKRREEKKAEKIGEKLGNPFLQDLYDKDELRGEIIIAGSNGYHEGGDDVAMPDADRTLGFVIDTVGEGGAVQQPAKPLAIVDTAGNDTYDDTANLPVPLDPRLWEGKKISDLPRHIRKARKEWMALRRTERKQAKLEAKATQSKSSTAPPKTRGERKTEAREAFVKQILFNSRKELSRTGMPPHGAMTIEGVEGVPMVKVESRTGMYSKFEISLARTVARRVLRNVKREEKAKKGKGKGSKKRERRAKDAAVNAGISGSTDKARLEAGSGKSTKADVLL